MIKGKRMNLMGLHGKNEKCMNNFQGKKALDTCLLTGG
jgi:hypothetical protein